ncbi:dihydrofolate reductase family protein [Parenemella sanctibonifatiensis]|uniref:Bacterial bifunctional deaminase-reductase C-terminal domain-containing protein n=1 Tax=Parenemella sanctibonifatiensis TaxID=2016505 RepID=A0A255EMK4_9ACTN|nr:hypothetical protein CGZ91_10640 [Parenemella sanctibonifatiensis]
MSTPAVVLTPIASIDGRITPGAGGPLLAAGVSKRWESLWARDTVDLVQQRSDYLVDRFSPRVTLEGADSFITSSAPTRPSKVDGSWPRPPAQCLRGEAESLLAVTDSRGRVEWTHQQKGRTELVVLIAESTPIDYVRALYDREISYLTIGRSQVDLRRAVRELAALTGTTTIIGAGGGHLNGALCRAGLVSELHLITFPSVVGVVGSTSFLEGAEQPIGTVTRLGEIHGSHGSTWTQYAMTRPYSKRHLNVTHVLH